MKGYIGFLVGLCVLSLIACSQPAKSSTNQMNSFPVETLHTETFQEKLTVYLWEDEERTMPLISHVDEDELTEAHEKLVQMLLKGNDPFYLEQNYGFIDSAYEQELSHLDQKEIELVVMESNPFADKPIFRLSEGVLKRTLAIHSLQTHSHHLKEKKESEHINTMQKYSGFGL